MFADVHQRNTGSGLLIIPFPYFKLQGCVAAAGRQRGDGRVVQAIGEEGAAGERQVVGVLGNRWGNG